MGFSQEWDEQYTQGAHLSVWPFTDLVAFVHRHARPMDGFSKVLELGCGAGANIRLFQELGSEYYAIEGSKTMVQKLHEEYPGLSAFIKLGDFTKEIDFDITFDCVVDRSSLTCNNTESIQQCLNIVASKMRKGGKYLATDWFSVDHSASKSGEAVDEFTRRNIKNSHLEGIGCVHFSDANHIKEIFKEAGLNIILLEHKKLESHMSENTETVATWNFIAEKI